MFVTLYQCIVMFEDYLGFKHRYNLEVEDNQILVFRLRGGFSPGSSAFSAI